MPTPNTAHLQPPTKAAVRRKARVAAVQALYEIDGSNHKPNDALQTRIHQTPTNQDTTDFTQKLVHGVLANRTEIDTIISTHAPHWPINQMAMVDRNILRIAIFEILMDSETPHKVAINEAIELGKIYGADRSPMFVNGVLGALMQHHQHHRTPNPTTQE